MAAILRIKCRSYRIGREKRIAGWDINGGYERNWEGYKQRQWREENRWLDEDTLWERNVNEGIFYEGREDNYRTEKDGSKGCFGVKNKGGLRTPYDRIGYINYTIYWKACAGDF